MNLAYKQALLAYKNNEVPVGCVIVKNDKVIAKAYNQKIKKNNPLSHSEIECIKKACKKINSKYLSGCEMYVTLEPCLMCAGAIIQSRIDKVYIATLDPKGGAFGSSIDVTKVKKINHYPRVEIGLMKDECSNILKEFFKSKRETKHL